MKNEGHKLEMKAVGGGTPPAAGGIPRSVALPKAAPVWGGPGYLFKTKYLFTLNAVIDQQFVGETPGGFRIDLAYSAPAPPPAPATIIKPPSALKAPLLQYVTGASLLSGTDWISVSKEGIVDFDSRVTLSLSTAGLPNPPSEPCLISARLRGRSNLHDTLDPASAPLFLPGDGSNKVISDWRKGFPTGSALEVTLAVTADVPIEGFDAKQTAIYQNCLPLGNSLLLGRARVAFTQGDFGAASAIELDVYAL